MPRCKNWSWGEEWKNGNLFDHALKPNLGNPSFLLSSSTKPHSLLLPLTTMAHYVLNVVFARPCVFKIVQHRPSPVYPRLSLCNGTGHFTVSALIPTSAPLLVLFARSWKASRLAQCTDKPPQPQPISTTTNDKISVVVELAGFFLFRWPQNWKYILRIYKTSSARILFGQTAEFMLIAYIYIRYTLNNSIRSWG